MLLLIGALSERSILGSSGSRLPHSAGQSVAIGCYADRGRLKAKICRAEVSIPGGKARTYILHLLLERLYVPNVARPPDCITLVASSPATRRDSVVTFG